MLFGPLLANYRGIFFAMLSLSLSMILYGTISKMTSLGGTDGHERGRLPTFLRLEPRRPGSCRLALYFFTIAHASCTAGGLDADLMFDSEPAGHDRRSAIR